jgi:proline iminopeptidase
MTERFVNGNGARLWTVAQGDGPPLLLCNGGAGCCDYLEPVAAMVNDLAQVVRFEQRGCGRSDSTPPYDVATCIADLECIRQHYGIDRWVAGGHSWGADLALAYALAHPDRVTGLICIAGGRVHNDREWHNEYDRKQEEVGELLPDFKYPPNMEVNRQLGQDWKQHYIQRPTLFREIADFTQPALFVYGSEDIRPRWPQEQVAQLMPNATFELIHGAPHSNWLTHPDELKSSLRRYLTTLSATGANML